MLPVKPTATAGTTKVSTPAVVAPKAAAPAKQQPIALPGAAEIAARNNPLPKSSPEDAVKPETMTSAPAEKEKSIAATRREAEQFLESREDTSAGGTSWERIAKLVDLSGKGTKGGASGSEKAKFRELLMSLKKDEKAPGATGY